MRILQAVPCFHPYWGGPVKVVKSISEKLIERGHEVVVYTSDFNLSDTQRGAEDSNGVDVHFFRNLNTWITRSFKIPVNIGIIKAVKEQLRSFDIIHLHEYRTFQNIVIHYYATKQGIPYVLQAHGTLPRIMAKRRLKWIYDVFFGDWLLRDTSKVIALSQTEAQQYRDAGVAEEKIEVIPNGIDLSGFNDLPERGAFRKKHSIAEDGKVILYLGRIHRSKGLDLLINAYSIVSKMLKETNLVIVGPDDGYLSSLAKLISGFGITDKVLLTGFVDENEKIAALMDSDVFASPIFSGFPITFLEACLFEVPIVTTVMGDQLDWIHNNVGFITNYSSSEYAKALYKIITNDDLERKFKNNCRLVIKKFDTANMVSALERAYEKAIDDKS